MKNTSPVKNTDPKKLDRSNEGDGAVLVLDDGGTVSCIITDVNQSNARFAWKTGPGRFDQKWVWLPRAQWLDHVTLFPAGCKFLAV
jgi:hypothetical protein